MTTRFVWTAAALVLIAAGLLNAAQDPVAAKVPLAFAVTSVKPSDPKAEAGAGSLPSGRPDVSGPRCHGGSYDPCGLQAPEQPDPRWAGLGQERSVRCRRQGRSSLQPRGTADYVSYHAGGPL